MDQAEKLRSVVKLKNKIISRMPESLPSQVEKVALESRMWL